MSQMNWKGRNVLVTGGCSFIGSHLVDALIARGATVRIADDLSSGRLENIQQWLDLGMVEMLEGNLLDPGAAQRAVEGMSVVFHLAANHGGRGYIDLGIGVRSLGPSHPSWSAAVTHVGGRKLLLWNCAK